MADIKRKRRKTANKAARSPAPRSGADARSVAIGVFAGIGAIAAIAAGVFGLARRVRTDGAGHRAPDLAADAPPVGSERAPEAFRPDPTAAVPASEREGLRPATGHPSITAIRGELASQTGAANG